MLYKLVKGAYWLLTESLSAREEFTSERFTELVFCTRNILTTENELKFIEALTYCKNLPLSSRREAFLYFEANIVDGKGDNPSLPRKAKDDLQFCFRFLPFLTILIYQNESDSLAPSSEQILLNYFNVIKNNFDLALRALRELSKNVSNTVKDSVLRSLEAILFPFNDLTNQYWQHRLNLSGGKNFSDFPIYFTYLTLLKHWNMTSEYVKSGDPIRAFFSNGKSIQISHEYTELEIINIANSIIKMKYEFPNIMENTSVMTNFRLSMKLIENWASGGSRLAASLHLSGSRFDSVVKPVIIKVFLFLLSFLSSTEIEQTSSMFPELFIRDNEAVIPLSVIQALKFIFEFTSLSLQAGKKVRNKSNTFYRSFLKSIAKYLTEGGVSSAVLIQIFDMQTQVDSLTFRNFEEEIVKLLLTPPKNDNISLKLFLCLSPDIVLAEDTTLRTLVFPVIISSAKRTINYSDNNVADLHIVFDKYFISKMNKIQSLPKRCKLIVDPILEIFKVIGKMDQIRNKDSLGRFFWFILTELSRVSVTNRKTEEIESFKMQIKQSLLDGEHRRVIMNKFRKIFLDESVSILTHRDNGLLKAESPIYLAVAEALGKLCFEALTSSLESMTERITEIQKTLQSLNSMITHSTPIATTYVVEGINYVHRVLLENRFSPPREISSFASALDQYIKGLTNSEKSTELKILLKAREKLFEYVKDFEKDIEEGNFNRKELLILTGRGNDGVGTGSTINVSYVVNILSSFTENEQLKDQKAFSDSLRKSCEKITAEKQRTFEFINIIDFLDGCHLLGGNAVGNIESKNNLMNRFFNKLINGQNDISLKDLVRINEQFEFHFKGEIISDQSFASLRKFAKQSNLYMKAFRAGLDQSKKSHERDARVRIDSAAAFAINNLNNLVLNEDSRINDFQLNADLLIHFRKDQQQQQKTRETELNLIVEFFQTAGGRNSGLTAGAALSSAMFTANSNVYKRLTAAFDLNRYLLLLDNLIKALNHLNLHLLAEHFQLSDCYQILQKDNGNFKISQSLELLESLLTCIGKLSLIDIQVLIRVGSSSSALLLDFFQKKGEQFGPTVNNAKQIAVRNPHLLGILAKLESVHQLLQPFWSTVTVRFTSFPQLKKYFDDRTFTNDVLIDIDEVIKYFPDIQDYLIEEHDGKSSDIVRIATKNLKGQYQSSLRSHLQGESFSLLLKSEQFSQEIDHRKLEEQVQWARLAKSSQEGQLEDDILQCFIEGYEFAKEVHTIRLLLESLGHPDYQEDAKKELNP